MTGDLVQKEPLQAGVCRLGIVVAVQPSNSNATLPVEIYPHVYYVFFPNLGVDGPLFRSQLSRV